MSKPLQVVFFILFFISLAKGQQKFQWSVKAGDIGNDASVDMVALDDNIYVNGTFDNGFSSGEYSLNTERGSFFLKLDKNGKTTLLKSLECNELGKMAILNKNIIVCGNAGNPDERYFSVYSLTEDGNINWTSKLFYTGFGTIDAIETTAYGDILIGGMIQGTLTIGESKLNSQYDKRAYLVNLSSDGKPKSAVLSTGIASHRLVSIAKTIDGGCFLLFSITGALGFGEIAPVSPTSTIEYGLALAKTDPSGKVSWIKVFSGTDFFEGIKVLALSTGEALVCSNYTGKVTIGNSVFGINSGYMNSSLWLLSSDGVLLKSRTITSPVAIRSLDMVLTPNNHAILTGYFRQEYSSGDTFVNSKTSFGDTFLVEVNENLEIIWHDEPFLSEYNTNANYCTAITLNSRGDIILAGSFGGQLKTPDKMFTSAQNDVFIGKYYTCDKKEISIEGNSVICPGGQTELSVKGDFTYYSWNNSWSDKTIIVNQPGTYSAIATDNAGCTGTGTITVELAKIPLLELPSDTVVYPGKPILLVANDEFESYLWDNGSTSYERIIDYKDSAPCKYFLKAVSKDGCTVSDTIRVRFAKAGTENSQPYLRSWPNPVFEKLWWYLELSGQNQVNVDIINDVGSIVYEDELKNYNSALVQTIDMKQFSSGCYFLRCRTPGKIFVQKLFKVR